MGERGTVFITTNSRLTSHHLWRWANDNSGYSLILGRGDAEGVGATTEESLDEDD